MSTNALLVRAYQLIKAGQYAEAEAILEPYLLQHSDDANGWWLLANAVRSNEDRIAYLQKVLALNPAHAPARRSKKRYTVSRLSSFERTGYHVHRIE